MIRKDKFTYHLSVDPIFMYGLNSLLGKGISIINDERKNGISQNLWWHMLFPYFMQRIRSPYVCISHHVAQNTSWSRHQIIVTLPISYLDKSS